MIASDIDMFRIPPAALTWPPPLKFARANELTSISPFERSETLTTSLSYRKKIETFTPPMLKP